MLINILIPLLWSVNTVKPMEINISKTKTAMAPKVRAIQRFGCVIVSIETSWKSSVQNKNNSIFRVKNKYKYNNQFEGELKFNKEIAFLGETIYKR